MKRIGLIGGMGPAASIDLYAKIMNLTPATKDQEHIPLVIDSYPQIEDRTEYILNQGISPLNRLQESAIRLEKAGAEALIMACNTAHFFAPQIQEVVSIPLIHIVECTALAIKNNYPNAKKIGVIATTGTKKARVYDDILERYGFKVLEFSNDLNECIMDCIYKGVKAGKTQEYTKIFQQCVDEIIGLKADALIAGCTEIPLLTPFVSSSIPIVDATLELAKVAVDFALEKSH